MPSTAIAHINLTALQHNLGVVRQRCPNSRIMAMVKANAYGHGLVRVAKALAGADGLAVARLEEALILRQQGVNQRILLLATLLDASELQLCSQLHIDVTAHDQSSLALITMQARYAPLRVWLKLDSGMHRMGLGPEAFIEASRGLAKHPGIVEVMHMSHFSSADDPASAATQRQLACFQACHAASPRAPVSLANSAALLSRAETHADWVRPGIMLYGINPLQAVKDVSLRSVMTLRSRVIVIREVGEGESVGYNERWTSIRRSRIATIGIGYGDGYPRHARTGTPVWIEGATAPLVGRVSMDSLAVDITDLEGVAVGDEVTLWGAELPAPIVAKHADTIAYQLFTSVQQRVTFTT